MHGSALVALDDERAALATVLVLQEMGLAVDIAVDRDRSVEWARQAGYSYVVCGGEDDEAGVKDFAAKMRFAVPQTRVLLLAGSDFDSSGLEAIGVEVLPSPVEVNSLVERLWPAQAA
jgi:ActR/RegA family two-component response regulator